MNGPTQHLLDTFVSYYDKRAASEIS